MAVQVQILQTALVRRLRRVHFEGVDVQMTAGCAVFITTKTRYDLTNYSDELLNVISDGIFIS